MATSMKGFTDLGIKPEAPMAGPSKKESAKPYYPSMHIGEKSGLDLPAGEHQFHVKAMVSKTVHHKAGEEPRMSHDLEITHIKHIGPTGATKSAEDATDGLDKELGKIAKQKMGNSGQKGEQTDAASEENA